MKSIDKQKGLSLSDYYPKDTVYFYSFPAGDDSRFYNQVPTYDEELVSGRPLICAGDDIKVVTFAATSEDYILRTLSKSLPLTKSSNIITLPKHISAHVTGNERDELVKRALYDSLDDGKLVMAQPFLDRTLEKKFKISPELSVTLSDKNNRHQYVPDRYLPDEYAVFPDGQAFSRHPLTYPLPCVVKVTSSSSGDGVVICKNQADLAHARKVFRDITGSILVEEHIESLHNLGIQFGIPHDRRAAPTIIGFNEQITSRHGDFLGGIVNLQKSIPRLDAIHDVLLEEILPAIRERGWYGIGGIDVLIDVKHNFYFIDPNLRMTAAYAYVYLARINDMTCPLLSFTGAVQGGKTDFEQRIMPFASGRDAPLTIVSLTRHGNTFRFNAAIAFDSVDDLKRKAAALLEKGVEAAVLDDILAEDFKYSLL